MGSDFWLNGIEDDVSWITATSVEDILKRQMVRNSKGEEGMACLGISKSKGERVCQIVCGTIEDHGMRLIKTVSRWRRRTGICACVRSIYMILEHT